MKHAIIADIHANLEALQAVLADIEEQECAHIVCLGDIVGYNASPRACLDIVRSRNIPCVKGNHDEYCSTGCPLEGFNPHAAAAVRWTRAQLNEEQKTWLRELPLVRNIHDYTLVHATLDGPHRWGYIFDKLAAASSFCYQATPLCFFGHTHVPIALRRGGRITGGYYTKIEIEPNHQYFINPGAVCQSRDGNPKPSYAIYDTDKSTVELRRVDYDIAAAQKKIIDAGLPPRLAERLALGK